MERFEKEANLGKHALKAVVGRLSALSPFSVLGVSSVLFCLLFESLRFVGILF